MSAFAHRLPALRRDLAVAASGHGGGSSAAPAPPTVVPDRQAIDQQYTWDLNSIFPSWEGWEAAFTELDRGIAAYQQYAGTLAQGPDQLLRAMRDRDTLGQLSYKVWYYPSLQYDEDQRNNTMNARRQRVQLLIAKWQQATSWFNPELLKLPLATVRTWLDQSPELAVYRFAIEEVFRLQEHVLDEPGEKLLSLSDRLGSVPRDSYAALSTADARFSTITLSTGETTQVSYGQYPEAARHVPHAERSPSGLRGALRRLHHQHQHLRHPL